MRPRVKDRCERTEWTCGCGIELYGDFQVDDECAFQMLANCLQTEGSLANPPVVDPSETPVVPVTPVQKSKSQDPPIQPSTFPAATKPSQTAISPTKPPKSPKFLALCVNRRGIYKTLAELDMTETKSDAEAFLMMKNAYLQNLGLRSSLTLLIKLVTVEFVRFTLWNLRHGYVSVCDRPRCVPPKDRTDYDCLPRPLPLPPMPPETFIYYLEHGESDLNPNRHVWLPRLPKRLEKGVVHCGEATDGWGIHIIEGLN
ncbi:hypothetical protein B0H67DRAFT_387629 [Lasiosphaeris hirsuta]|uniref:Uncharacterized protein n=1 Tax=Lasiosphaeris hirsuta TaxID=260670 RepID=A0AA40DJM9_9PEZI|nr:hypothetical protein B0H67DRAFT_387629 [Lasiosphaeris hirsuta]